MILTTRALVFFVLVLATKCFASLAPTQVFALPVSTIKVKGCGGLPTDTCAERMNEQKPHTCSCVLTSTV